jgi:hypothetical protein
LCAEARTLHANRLTLDALADVKPHRSIKQCGCSEGSILSIKMI